MHTSALSLAISIPATTKSSCAIIQLPSLLGPGSKPMQLFGLRKTPDLSLAPRQALRPLSTTGSDPATGGWSEPPVRTFWQILQTQEHGTSCGVWEPRCPVGDSRMYRPFPKSSNSQTCAL